MTDRQTTVFFAARHAEAVALQSIWNNLQFRAINVATTEFVKQFVSYVLGCSGVKFEDLTPSEQFACVDYQFDIFAGVTPSPETMEAIRGIYPPAQ